MGLILPQEIYVLIVGRMIKYYEEKGYGIPKHYDKKHQKFTVQNGTIIKVNVLDLKRSSNKIVKVQCDCCNKILEMQYDVYNRYVRDDRKYYCTNCECKNISYLKHVPQENKIKADNLITDLKVYIDQNGYPKNMRNTFKPENGLSHHKTYKNILGGCLVDWIEMCGYKLSEDEKFNMLLHSEKISYTKDEVISIVMDMSHKFDRPLMYDDFRKPTRENVGITYIQKYFGTFNKMKKELGLEIIQENMIDRTPSKDDLDISILKITEYAKSLKKDFITEREIRDYCKNSDLIHYVCMDKWCKRYYDVSFSTRLKELGINMSNPGNGIVSVFDDGERTTSQFEYMFSTYLRNRGLKYNTDYFRDIRYSSIDKEYSGMMNCDYVINCNGHKIYIEIAGMIEEYKKWYYTNKSITRSKSKEYYRLKLHEKEQMFKRNHLTYFILFPCDITRDICNSILKNPTVALRKEIEKRYKNNIDWKIIQKTGALKYFDKLGRDGQPIVDYGEAI